MKKWKIWLIVALCLIILGGGIFVVVLAANGWSFRKFDDSRYETNTYTIQEGFQNISVDTNTTDVVFLPSMDGECKVVAYEKAKLTHNVSVADGTLSVRVVDERKWYDHISLFNFEEPRLKVYLPQTEYGNLTLENSTGDINIPKAFTFANINIRVDTGDVDCFATVHENIKIAATTGDVEIGGTQAKDVEVTTTTGDISISNVVCESLKVNVSTGDIELENVVCNTLASKGSTGDIELENVLASTSIYIERSTGEVSFERMDGGEITITTDTGDVRGSLLSEKIFIVETDTGDKNVPQTTTGGNCKITTDTGDITIRIAQ